MAASGEKVVLVQQYNDRKTHLKFYWAIKSQDAADNSSVIAWSMLFYATDGGFYAWNQDQPYKIVINGTEYTGKANIYLPKGSPTKNLVSGTTQIYHDATGRKTFSYSFSQYFGDTIDDYVGSTGTGELDAIARKANILTAPNFNDDADPTITYSNPAGNSLTALEACIANSTGNTIYVPYRAIDPEGSSYTFYLTDAERKTLRAAASGNSLAVRFYVKTTAGTENHYSFLSRTMSLSDTAPSFNPTVRDTNSTTLALTGNSSTFILGYSDLYYTTGATGQKEATISRQVVSCGSQVLYTGSGTFTAVDGSDMQFTATDSRGNVGYYFLTLDTIPYFKVTCNQTVRLNLDGTADLVVTGNYFDGYFGNASNTLSVQIRHREDGGAWGDWATLDPLISDISNGTYRLTATISGYDASGTHEFQSRAIDKLHTAYSGEESVVLTPIFDWSRNDFNFNVPLTIEGYPLADYVVETGTEPMGTNGTWYWSKWKSGKAECYGRRNYGNMGLEDWGDGWYASEGFMQDLPSGLFSEMPQSIDISVIDSPSGPCQVLRGYLAGAGTLEKASESSTDGFIILSSINGPLSQVLIGFNVIGRWY